MPVLPFKRNPKSRNEPISICSESDAQNMPDEFEQSDHTLKAKNRILNRLAEKRERKAEQKRLEEEERRRQEQERRRQEEEARRKQSLFGMATLLGIVLICGVFLMIPKPDSSMNASLASEGAEDSVQAEEPNSQGLMVHSSSWASSSSTAISSSFSKQHEKKGPQQKTDSVFDEEQESDPYSASLKSDKPTDGNDAPRDPRVITADDIPSLNAGDYVSITGGGSTYVNDNGTIQLGSERLCGIRLTVIGEKAYTVEADSVNVDAFADVFKTHSAAELNGATMTLTGTVKMLRSNDIEMGYMLFGFEFNDDATLTDIEI